MKKIKMIGLDLDGTLLNSRKELTPYTKDILIEAMRQGVVVVVSTGRPLEGVPKEILALPGMHYVLTANGARIIDIQERKVLWENLVPDQMAKKVVKILEEYDTLKEICYNGESFARQDELQSIGNYVTDPHMAYYIQTTRTAVPDLWDKIEQANGLGMDKVQGVFARMDERSEAAARIHKLGSLSVSGAMGNNLEINAPGVNKGVGLLKLGELLGIARDEIMACGDGNNDLDMINAVGLGVAMGNAISEIKDAADYVTGSNEEDGAACAVKKFVLPGYIPGMHT